MRHTVVAIDGPAASGKSTVSRELARRLGFSYVNSGSLYRAATWWALRAFGSVPASGAELVKSLRDAEFSAGIEHHASFVEVGGTEPGTELFSETVNGAVSAVSALPEVRELILGHLRACADQDSIVMEGRDIGTVVFPEARYKFYLDASPQERERRRAAQGGGDSIEKRDRIDSTRKAAPLKPAPDAWVVDSTSLTLHGVVEEILFRLEQKGLVVTKGAK